MVSGATGECGKEIVKELSKQPLITSVTLIGRRQIDLPETSFEEGTDYTKFKQVVVDFDNLEEYSDAFQGFDMGFCALGTTIKKAGNKATFYRVDHDYVVNAATMAKAGGCKHMIVSKSTSIRTSKHFGIFSAAVDLTPTFTCTVSSTSANKNSFIYYSKVKGRMEEDVTAIGFERLTIARPGGLK